MVRNRLNDADIAVLAPAFVQCAKLKCLELNSNDIMAEGVLTLGTFLPRCAALETLNLSNLGFGDAGVLALADVLPECAQLANLNLNGVKFGPEALTRCRSLRSLHVAHCQSIGDDGVVAVANAMPRWPGLVELSATGMCNTAAIALGAAMPRCPNLRSLRLVFRDIDEDGVDAIAAALPHCTKLESLCMYNLYGYTDNAYALVATIRDNPRAIKKLTLGHFDKELIKEVTEPVRRKAWALAAKERKAAAALGLSPPPQAKRRKPA